MSDQTVFNPALGPSAPPINMPAPVTPPPAAPQQQFGNPAPHQEFNPFAQPAPSANPFAQPAAPANPFGAPQVSPYAAPPLPAHQQQPVPYQPAPQQPAPNPAFQFTPQAPGTPAFQPVQQAPGTYQVSATPAAPANPLMPPSGQQPQAPAQQPAQQSAQQAPASYTPEDIQQMFPDDTSRALFTGANALATAHQIDLLQAFDVAYQTKDVKHINERYLAQFDPNVVAQLKGQFQALVGVEQQRTQQTVQTVHQMAGGQAQWNAAIAVFNKACPPETSAIITDLFNSGDPQKVQFAAQQVLSFAAQSGQVVQRNPNAVQNPGAGNGAGQMLSKEQFFQQLDYLAQAHAPGSPEYDRHYQQLVEQRTLAKSYGY